MRDGEQLLNIHVSKKWKDESGNEAMNKSQWALDYYWDFRKKKVM